MRDVSSSTRIFLQHGALMASVIREVDKNPRVPFGC